MEQNREGWEPAWVLFPRKTASGQWTRHGWYKRFHVFGSCSETADWSVEYKHESEFV